MCESVGKADLLSDHFDSKQSLEAVDLPLTCHQSPSLTTFAFRWSEVRRLLLDLTLMVALTHWVCFLFFLRELLMLWPPIFVLLFWGLVRLGSFSACYGQTNVIPIPKGPPSSPVANYRPIYMTSVLSKVLELLVSVRLGRIMGRFGVLPSTQFAYLKSLGTLMHFCACPIYCRVHWRMGTRLGSCKLNAVQIRAFSISSALWVLEVLCCLY